jgi:16S rRNA (guanine966-N2)-methyltransferase
MRVIAGRHRGRAIAVPPGRAVRPTASRAREALFDILNHAAFVAGERVMGARVLDAFAGTGALGIEALSRGALHASFLERDPDARALLLANIRKLGEEGRATILAVDAVHPPRATAPCQLVLMDPPYGEAVAAPSLAALAEQGWIAPGAIIALELPATPEFVAPAGFALLDERRYGRARILFLGRN